MKMNKKVSIQGEFAKIGEDIRDGDTITILDAGKVISGEYGERTAFHIETAKGEDKVLSFNQTSINNLVDAYGEDSEGWKGKKAKAWVVKTMVSGKLRNVAYLAHPDWTMNDDGTFVGSADSDLQMLDDEAGDDVDFS